MVPAHPFKVFISCIAALQNLRVTSGYFGNMDRFCTGYSHSTCALQYPRIAQPVEELASQQQGLHRKRIAVLVVGLKSRFYPLPTLKHVVAPAAADGYDVDYFAMLSSTSSHLVNHTDWEAYWYRPVPHPRIANLSFSGLESYLIRH